MQLFIADARIYFFILIFFLKNMNKLPSKVAHNRPQFFFSVLPTGPKSAQIPFSVS